MIGEYAILQHCGILIGHPPHFSLKKEIGSYAAQSPAGLYLKSHPEVTPPLLHDPHQGKGGFGGSSAEFIAVYFSHQELNPSSINRAWNVWNETRIYPGSGADFLTQAYGLNRDNAFCLYINFPEKKLLELPPLGIQISLFHTGKKLATHEHLKNHPKIPPLLAQMVDDTKDAWIQNDKDRVKELILSYSKQMAELELLAKHTQEVLNTLPRDIYAKGCGAMGNDVILVVNEPEFNVSQWAEKNSLSHIQTMTI